MNRDPSNGRLDGTALIDDHVPMGSGGVDDEICTLGALIAGEAVGDVCNVVWTIIPIQGRYDHGKYGTLI